MFTFRKKYAWWALLLFLTEIIIALFVKDKFIRPHGGDFLVVILIYCTVRTFWKGSSLKVAVAVLLFAYAVEFSQYFGLISYLGLQNSRLAMVIMGKSFQWYDMLAYTLGIIVVILIEKGIRKVE